MRLERLSTLAVLSLAGSLGILYLLPGSQHRLEFLDPYGFPAALLSILALGIAASRKPGLAILSTGAGAAVLVVKVHSSVALTTFALSVACVVLLFLHGELLHLQARFQEKRGIPTEVVRVTGQGQFEVDLAGVVSRFLRGYARPLGVAVAVLAGALAIRYGLVLTGGRIASSLEAESVVGLALGGAAAVAAATLAIAARRRVPGRPG